MRLSSAFALPLLVLSLTAHAQHPTLNTQKADAPPAQKADTPDHSQPTQTLSVDARLVNLPVVVRDNKGALVQNLTKADFTLEVDNHPQTIRYFDVDSNLPLTLGLLVDTSESLRKSLDEERAVSTAFLDQMLTEKQDQAFVVQFARTVELLQDLTSSRPKLQAALKDLDTPAPADRTAATDPSDTSTDRDRPTRNRAGTVLYDAAFLAADEVTAKQHGRKALIILTDGDDRGSKERLADAIEAAQRADTIIYAVYFKGGPTGQQSNFPVHRGGGGYPGSGYPGGGYPGGYPGRYPGGGYPGGGYPGGGYPGGGTNPPPARNDSKNVLNRMTRETGGRLFEVSRKQSIADIFTEIGKELRSQYRLGYTPTDAITGDGYHQVDLFSSGPDAKKYTIQTRDGYYTGK